MKKILFLLCIPFAFACRQSSKKTGTPAPEATPAPVVAAAEKNNSANVYDINIQAIDGGKLDLAAYKGKKILIVNTASQCGYTPQYTDLQKLYDQYKEKLVVIGFPANDFGGQEPGSNDEIKSFCQKNHGVTFPLSAKVTVKGEGMHPLFQWLTQKDKNGVMDAQIKWNFTKFLLDEKGQLMKMFPSAVKPMSEEIVSLL
jgi:glutathione peroxidase